MPGSKDELSNIKAAKLRLEDEYSELLRKLKIIEQSKNKYRDLFDFSPVGLMVLNKSGNIQDMNRTASTLLDVEKKRLRHTELSDYIAETDVKKYFDSLERAAIANQALNIVVRTNGSQAFLAHLVIVPMLNSKIEVTGFYVAIIDVSDTGLKPSYKKHVIDTETDHGLIHEFEHVLSKQLAEWKLNTLDCEKKSMTEDHEFRLKELHHRTKNNLNMVYHLLEFDASDTGDMNTEAIYILKQSQSRILTIARLQEQLYLNNNLPKLDFGSLILAMANDLVGIYAIDTESIDIEINVEKVEISPTNSTYLSLLINELLTNSFQHAFDADDKGQIFIEMNTFRNDRVSLTYRDNGKGFPDDVDFYSSNSFGLDIIRMFTEKLGGTIDFESRKGLTEFSMKLKV